MSGKQTKSTTKPPVKLLTAPKHLERGEKKLPQYHKPGFEKSLGRVPVGREKKKSVHRPQEGEKARFHLGEGLKKVVGP